MLRMKMNNRLVRLLTELSSAKPGLQRLASKWLKKGADILMETSEKVLPLPDNPLSRDQKEAIAKLRDSRKGKQCFIVANGPSLNSVDLSRIIGEEIFCLNQAILTKEFDLLKPDYYAIWDPAYFDHENIHRERNKGNIFYQDVVPVLNGLDRSITVFLPISANRIVGQYDLFQQHELIYLHSYYTECVDKIDLVNWMPPIKLTAHVVLNVAIYMGYGEIYLLGFDQDFIRTIECREDNRKYIQQRHYYNTSVEVCMTEKFADLYVGSARTCEIYEILHQYAIRNGVNIYNLNTNSLLDTFPKMEIENVRMQ